MTRALYAGTFDPLTFGHLDLIERGARLFDELVVAVADNSRKQPLFTAAERVAMISAHTDGIAGVSVVSFGGLVVDYAAAHGIDVLLRGLRTVSDFEFEYQMAMTNRSLSPDIDTAFVMPSQEYAFLSSSLIKEVMRNGGDASRWLPDDVAEAVKQRLAAD